MTDSRNYGTPTTRHLVTGRIETVIHWCAADPSLPIGSKDQAWWLDREHADDDAKYEGWQLVKRVRQISTSYITEEASNMTNDAPCPNCGHLIRLHAHHSGCIHCSCRSTAK